jgi:hypothetical protein
MTSLFYSTNRDKDDIIWPIIDMFAEKARKSNVTISVDINDSKHIAIIFDYGYRIKIYTELDNDGTVLTPVYSILKSYTLLKFQNSTLKLRAQTNSILDINENTVNNIIDGSLLHIEAWTMLDQLPIHDLKETVNFMFNLSNDITQDPF